MTPQPALTESMENYLEAILNLEKTQKVARVKDIADKLSLQRGSVSGALKSLEEKGLINYTALQLYHPDPRRKKNCRRDHPSAQSA